MNVLPAPTVLGRLPEPAVWSAAGESGKESGPGLGLRVMIVEDEAIAAMELEMLLDALGCAVCAVAIDGDEALAAAAATLPDLILMDIRLANNSDGVEAATEIMRRHGIRSLFLTAHSDAATLERTQGAAPYGVLTKPYPHTQLVAHLRRAAEDLGRG